MKTVLALVVFVAIAAQFASASYTGGDGKPSCTQKNVATGIFRNNWDPTRYWKCESVGQEPVSVNCPYEEGYMDSKRKCVSWDEWEWEKPNDPPSD